MPKKFEVGDRVRVIARGHYKDRAVGRFGVVKSCWWGSDSIGVTLEGISNGSSKYGYFYFKSHELEFLSCETTNTKIFGGENTMQNIENYINIALVQFLDDSRAPAGLYEYANFDESLQVGDQCVVMSAHHGLGLAEVVDFKEKATAPVLREIVARFDTSAYNARVEQRKKAADLKIKMQERAKQLQDLALYQVLAQNDSEMAQMVKDYLDLVNP